MRRHGCKRAQASADAQPCAAKVSTHSGEDNPRWRLPRPQAAGTSRPPCAGRRATSSHCQSTEAHDLPMRRHRECRSTARAAKEAETLSAACRPHRARRGRLKFPRAPAREPDLRSYAQPVGQRPDQSCPTPLRSELYLQHTSENLFDSLATRLDCSASLAQSRFRLLPFREIGLTGSERKVITGYGAFVDLFAHSSSAATFRNSSGRRGSVGNGYVHCSTGRRSTGHP